MFRRTPRSSPCLFGNRVYPSQVLFKALVSFIEDINIKARYSFPFLILSFLQNVAALIPVLGELAYSPCSLTQLDYT